MKIKNWVWGLGIILFSASVTAAPWNERKAPASSTHSAAGSWIVSGGFGLTFSPTLVLLNPQLEYVHDSHLSFGPMIQAGLGDATLVTFSGTVRYQIGTHPKLRPNVEGGLGMAVASAYYTSSVGVHIMFGMGADYMIDNSLSVGTSFRVNLAPPVDTFFLSWPLVVVRLKI